MNSDKDYIQFIAALKQNIVQSRYIAASLANREQLLLYFKTGKMLSEKIAVQKWGAKVIEQVSEDLRKQLPGFFRDEYLMDFMGLDENADERKVESEIVSTYRVSKEMPDDMRDVLPTVDGLIRLI